MKATAAVLGSCLQILAVVDAISLAKLSGSNYNIEWAKIEPYDPNDSSGDIVENLVQYDPRTASINPLPNHQYEPNYNYLSSENMMPLEYIDSQQRESVDNESYLKIKLKLKIEFPRPNQVGETVVYEPNYVTVTDEEPQPYWLYHDYHENLSPYPASVEAYHRIHEISKNLPEHVKDELSKKVELLQHSSKIPNNVQEMTTESTEIHNETVETTQVDDYLNYLNKLQQLMDTLNKLKVNDKPDQVILPDSENKPPQNDITRNTPQIESSRLSKYMPEDPIEIAEFVRAANKQESGEPIINHSSPKIKANSRSFEGELFSDPHAKLYENIHKASKALQHPVTEDSHITSQLSRNTPQDPMQLSKALKSERAEDTEFKRRQLFAGEPGPGDTKKTFDPNSSENVSAQDEPLVMLYDAINTGSKAIRHTVGDYQTSSQLFSGEPGPKDTKKTFDPNSSENVSAQDEPLVMLYDAINTGSKAMRHTVGDYQTSSQLSEDVLKYQIEKSDRDYLGSGPESEDYQKDERYDTHRRYPKISQGPPIHHGWSNNNRNKVPRVEMKTDELPANTPEYQLTLSDPNEFQNSGNQDISGGFVGGQSMSMGIPSYHERTDSNRYNTEFKPSSLSAENENDRTTISKRANSLFTRILSLFG